MLKQSLLVLTIVTIIFAGCSSEDEGSSYSESDFYGTWELSNSTSADYKECPDDAPILEISESEITLPSTNDEGCQNGNFSTDYEFNGELFKVNILGQEVNLTIVSSSNSEFSWENDIDGATETYVKVN